MPDREYGLCSCKNMFVPKSGMVRYGDDVHRDDAPCYSAIETPNKDDNNGIQ